MELAVWRPSHSEGRSLDGTEQSQTPELSVTLTSTPPMLGGGDGGRGHSAYTSAGCPTPRSGGFSPSVRPCSGNHRKPLSCHRSAGSSQACMAPSRNLPLCEILPITPHDHSGLGQGGLEQRISLCFDEHASDIAGRFLLLCQKQPPDSGNFPELEVALSHWLPGAWAGPPRNKLDKAHLQKTPHSFTPSLLLQQRSLPLQIM